MRPTRKDLQDSYAACTEGHATPSVVVCSGAVILQHRPDLVGEIDPVKFYVVVDGEIRDADSDLDDERIL